jgi:hypothetical protein
VGKGFKKKRSEVRKTRGQKNRCPGVKKQAGVKRTLGPN